MGYTTLEIGVHTACALSEATWVEYAFQNYDHLVDTPVAMRDGFAHVSDRPGLGFGLSDDARAVWPAPNPQNDTDIQTGPPCHVLAQLYAQPDQQKTSTLILEETTQCE